MLKQGIVIACWCGLVADMVKLKPMTSLVVGVDAEVVRDRCPHRVPSESPRRRPGLRPEPSVRWSRSGAMPGAPRPVWYQPPLWCGSGRRTIGKPRMARVPATPDVPFASRRSGSMPAARPTDVVRRSRPGTVHGPPVRPRHGQTIPVDSGFSRHFTYGHLTVSCIFNRAMVAQDPRGRQVDRARRQNRVSGGPVNRPARSPVFERTQPDGRIAHRKPQVPHVSFP